jgi:Protein of unknown function (DUF2752).
MWNAIIEWLKEHMLTCPSKYFFHFDCPGCGLQRSFLYLLEGDIARSFTTYPATIPMILLFIYTGMHILFGFKHGAAIIKWGYIICIAIIVVFYIYKVITHKIFVL